MKLKKRHYKMALCANRGLISDPRGMTLDQVLARLKAVDSTWLWSLAAAKVKGYK